MCLLKYLAFFLLCGSTAIASSLNQKYVGQFSYQMTKQSLCPEPLSISVGILVKNYKTGEGNHPISGFIKNLGSSNENSFCNLYHTGKISGSVDPEGNILVGAVKQYDTHSAQYSSYKILGNINSSLTLISKSKKFHPNKNFQVTKTASLRDKPANNKNSSWTSTNSRKALENTDVLRDIFNSYTRSQRKQIQLQLKKRGFYSSSIDGLYGRGTKRAIELFATKNGYSVGVRRGLIAALGVLTESKVDPQVQQVIINETINLTEQTTFVAPAAIATKEVKSQTPLIENVYQWENASSAAEAQRFADEIQATVVMYMAIREVVIQQPQTTKDRVLSIVDSEIQKLQQQKILLQKHLSARFSTPIKPTNANLQISAFRASDTFPKVPFYVPGTNEIGETLVTPRVSDEGYLNYEFNFIDPVATYDKIRDSVNIPHEKVDVLITGIDKIDEWTSVAQENGVNRRVSKTAACIPIGACQVKRAGKSSTEIIFQIYEDGSTSGRIQINKGKFGVGYNMSVESTILLQAYLIYMRDVGAKEFNIGVMSDDQILDLFE